MSSLRQVWCKNCGRYTKDRSDVQAESLHTRDYNTGPGWLRAPAKALPNGQYRCRSQLFNAVCCMQHCIAAYNVCLADEWTPTPLIPLPQYSPACSAAL